jgi:hypothetical protein
MCSLCIVPLMASLCLTEKPTVDRPLLSIAPDAKVKLRHVKVGDRYLMRVEAAGVTFETARLRVQAQGRAFDLDAAEDGIRLELEDGGEAFFTEKTLDGGRKKKD